MSFLVNTSSTSLHHGATCICSLRLSGFPSHHISLESIDNSSCWDIFCTAVCRFGSLEAIAVFWILESKKIGKTRKVFSSLLQNFLLDTGAWRELKGGHLFAHDLRARLPECTMELANWQLDPHRVSVASELHIWLMGLWICRNKTSPILISYRYEPDEVPKREAGWICFIPMDDRPRMATSGVHLDVNPSLWATAASIAITVPLVKSIAIRCIRCIGKRQGHCRWCWC